MLVELLGLPGAGKTALRDSLVASFGLQDGDAKARDQGSFTHLARNAPLQALRSLRIAGFRERRHRAQAMAHFRESILHRSAHLYVVQHGFVHRTWLMRMQGLAYPLVPPSWPTVYISCPLELAKERIAEKRHQKLGPINDLLLQSGITEAPWKEGVLIYEQIREELGSPVIDNSGSLGSAASELACVLNELLDATGETH